MFKKRKCDNCGEKVNDGYNFCPYCRTSLKSGFEEEDWGLLGKNDVIDEPEEIRIPAGINALFNSLLKNLNQQMRELGDQSKNSKPKGVKKSKGISISISSFGNRPPEIKVSSFGNPELKQEERKKKIKLPVSDAGKFSGLPKKEPETNIRRLSNKIVYEIKLPGVKTIEDTSIIQLENSIEIKALSGKKVFYKVIPINLPINKYDLNQGILTLELDSKE